ncbi:MAG: hypothetical protein HY897_15025 [Deltaproteobacteria bacterium]|nr:hypothetical protein [Deltaproteobacteria bacterium]
MKGRIMTHTFMAWLLTGSILLSCCTTKSEGKRETTGKGSFYQNKTVEISRLTTEQVEAKLAGFISDYRRPEDIDAAADVAATAVVTVDKDAPNAARMLEALTKIVFKSIEADPCNHMICDCQDCGFEAKLRDVIIVQQVRSRFARMGITDPRDQAFAIIDETRQRCLDTRGESALLLVDELFLMEHRELVSNEIMAILKNSAECGRFRDAMIRLYLRPGGQVFDFQGLAQLPTCVELFPYSEGKNRSDSGGRPLKSQK